MGDAIGRAIVIGMLQAIKPLIGDADQLVGLVAILRKRGDAVVHVDADAQLQGLECFGKNRFDAVAEGQGRE